MRIAHIPPVQCSVCFQQKPDELHVDMEAAYDGPVLDVSGARHTIDDIVICEECVRAAARQLPEHREQQDRYDALAAQYANLLDYVALVQSGICKMQDALDTHLLPMQPPTKRPVARGGAVKVKV